MMNLVLVGGGALAREIFGWFSATHDFAGYLDDGDDPLAAFGYGLKHLGPVARGGPAGKLVMAIASPAGKTQAAETLGGAAGFHTLIHPSAVVATSARLGAGCVIAPFSMVSADAVVGDLVLVNAYSSVGHDVCVGDRTTLSCHVDLTGRVQVGEACFFGSGARVIPGVAIGDGATIGAGAVVMRRAPPGATLFAPPAKRL
jgi:sugar O-acyltransferase (sialic acid O-acetyltransferase NeuD family)